MSEQPVIAVVMGSDSDLSVMEPAVTILEEFGVPFELTVMSAHRTPDAVHAFATGASERGIKVIIAGAGGSAHLAGVIASLTILPVIGVPVPTDRAGGVDSLLSIVQMPRGVPVATMGIGKSGAQNGALLALQMLAISDRALAKALRAYRSQLTDAVAAADAKVKKWLEERV